MGLKDTAAIQFFADEEIFADAFNYYFFGSRKYTSTVSITKSAKRNDIRGI